jgi:hypothetical protein
MKVKTNTRAGVIDVLPGLQTGVVARPRVNGRP